MKASPRLVILGFHKIGPPPPGGWASWYYIPEETFVSQLDCLREGAWEVIDAETFLHGLKRPETLPPQSALITFDDGYRSFFDVALPCLREFGFPAVMFVPTAYVSGFNEFDSEVEPREPICDWRQLQELERQRISVQSHGVTHRALSDLNPVQQRIEICHSKLTLEQHLGKPVELLSFAYGDGGNDPQEIDRLLGEAGYRAAFLYGGGPFVLPATTHYRLPRLAVGPDTPLSEALETCA